jgi:phenylalanyl-tRNA synthetase beta subunit
MKLSYNWLEEFIKIKLTPEQLAEKLTLAGFEVEKINYGPKIKGVKTGEIISIRKHPKARKLKIVKVKIGRNKIINVVCGAQNIERKQKVPVALAGAEIVGLDVDGKPGKEPLVIQETEIKGVKSEGMLCAEDELGIGDDHSGIYILSPETKVGQDINKILELDDAILELEITSNRGDCLSVLGMARETAAVVNTRINMRMFTNKYANLDSHGIASSSRTFWKRCGTPRNDSLAVEVKELKLCPKYTARVIKNVRVTESPQWLRNRLRACGIRSINNIVDITNYVMMELGQPMHAFDFNQLTNNNQQLTIKKIIVRKAEKGEKIVTIDGKKQKLDEEMLVIADEKKPIAAAGVMGGKDTEVTEETTDIILESAQFDPISIRKTTRKLGLQSDSSYRFERGVDWNMTEVALDRAVELIFKLQNKKGLDKFKKSKIEIGEKIVIQQQERYLRRVIKLPVVKVSEVLGVRVSKQKVKGILENLGFRVAEYEIRKSANVRKDTELRKVIIEEAKKLLGKPYKYEAKELEAPKKFDCSSLTQYLYKKIGITIPRCSIDQAEIGYEIRKIYESTKLRKILKPGDLVLSRGTSPHYSINWPNGLGHVGIYIGAGKIIHTNEKKKKVTEESIEESIRKTKWRGARRILDSKFQIPDFKSQLIVTVPSWREDISIPEDLIEEVGRIYDYNKLKPTALRGGVLPPKINKELAWENLIKDTLTAAGMTEIYNYSFYGRTQMSTDENTDLHRKHLRVVNPINPDQEFLRVSLIPRLLEVIGKNIKNFDEVKIFEIGKVYSINSQQSTVNSELPDERKMVSGMILSQKLKIKNQKYRNEVFYQIKGIVELLFDKLGIDKDKIIYKFLADVSERNLSLQATGSAIILIEKEVLGITGETFTGLGFFELDFQKLIKYVKEKKKFQPISPYPAVERDLAIVIDKNIFYKDLVTTIKETDPLIKKIELFDIFEDEEKIGKNKKSLAFHLKFQAQDQTLRKSEVDIIFQNILKKLKDDFKAKIRG